MFQQNIRTLAKSSALALAGLGAIALFAPTDGAAQYYKGKTITILVGFSAGGGVDTSNRVLANHLGKHIPGNPKVIVRNMPGGSSTKAHNFVFEKANKDGQTIIAGPWFPISQLAGAPGIRFKYQDFTLLGGMKPAGYLNYVRADAVPGGVKSAADLKNAKNLRIAGQNPFNSFDLYARLSLDLMGFKYRYVPGYRGSSKIRAAVLSNEVSFASESANGYNSAVKKSMIDTGKVVAVWTIPSTDSSGKYVQTATLPHIPSVLKVYRQIHGKAPSGRIWNMYNLFLQLVAPANRLILGPPNMNPEAAGILRKAYLSAMNDPAHVAQATKVMGISPVAIDTAAAQRAVAGLKNADPKITAQLKAYINEVKRKK